MQLATAQDDLGHTSLMSLPLIAARASVAAECRWLQCLYPVGTALYSAEALSAIHIYIYDWREQQHQAAAGAATLLHVLNQ